MPNVVTDLADPIMFTNPFPRYAELRRDAPVSTVKSQQARGDAYMLTRYDDVMRLMAEPVFSSDALTNGTGGNLMKYAPRMFRLLTDSMVFKDDPDHKRLRGLVNKAFTPRRIQEMSDDIDEIVNELVATMATRDTVDLVEEFAVPLPLRVISKMLGVGESDRAEFLNMAKQFADATSGPLSMLKALPLGRRMMKMFDRLTAERRAVDDGRMIAALVRASEQDDKLADNEVVAMIFLLLLAGYDTTSNLIGTSVLELLAHPEQMALLRERPELIDSAVEELLRFTTPVPHGVVRVTTDAVDVAGTTIPKGASVLGMIISANRDESVFDNPDDLDLERSPNRHVTFAFGSHYCLGNQLARLEGRSAIRSLLEHFPDMQLAVPREQLQFKGTQSLRGLKALPLRLR